MTLDAAHLRYPHRRRGMDHERYAWSMLAERPAVAWPGGARLALWVNVAVQFFPLDQVGKPFVPPGGMATPYPDLRHFTLREYGNRVGIVRCLNALDAFGIRATFAVNAAVAERHPALLERLAARGDELVASSWHMDTPHHGDMPIGDERALVERSLSTLRRCSGQAVEGWVSPAGSQSLFTPELLVEHGVRYMGDWINDELPYAFRTLSGELVALPLSLELDDHFLIGTSLHSEWEYATQVKDACDYLVAEAEATGGGRLLALSIHPWLLGQPHRIGAFESVLEHLAATPGIWSASASEIVAAWRDQQD
ncbi:MAG: polysaccharide deacetylase family protein [Gammaproteobacteria bacterium]|nr:polysaccharide deacetylase family protein [Gammaproteobacteria bacterium]